MSLSVYSISLELDISPTSVWRILRRDLNHYPYKAHQTTVLSDKHKADRVQFCNWFLDQDEDFHRRVIWTGEKNFVERCRGNRQNERYWAPHREDPEVTEATKVVGGRKVMAWAAIIDGKMFMFWFEVGEREDQHRYS